MAAADATSCQNICSRGSVPGNRSTSSVYAGIRRCAPQLDLARYLPADYRVLNETKRTAVQSKSSVSRRTPLPPYPTEPPPAYMPRMDNCRAYPAALLEEGPDPTSNNPASLTEDEVVKQALMRCIYIGLRGVQFIFCSATLGVYVHAGNEGAIDGGGPNAIFAKLVSSMSLILAMAFAAYAVVSFRSGMDVCEGKPRGRSVWRYEWLIDLFLVYVRLPALLTYIKHRRS